MENQARRIRGIRKKALNSNGLQQWDSESRMQTFRQLCFQVFSRVSCISWSFLCLLCLPLKETGHP
jgi:hypothetical protein